MIIIALTAFTLTACNKNSLPARQWKLCLLMLRVRWCRMSHSQSDYPGYLEAESTVDLVGRVNGVLQAKNFARVRG